LGDQLFRQIKSEIAGFHERDNSKNSVYKADVFAEASSIKNEFVC